MIKAILKNYVDAAIKTRKELTKPFFTTFTENECIVYVTSVNENDSVHMSQIKEFVKENKLKMTAEKVGSEHEYSKDNVHQTFCVTVSEKPAKKEAAK